MVNNLCLSVERGKQKESERDLSAKSKNFTFYPAKLNKLYPYLARKETILNVKMEKRKCKIERHTYLGDCTY